MLQNFIIALKAVAPMFIIMAIGILVRRRNIMTDAETRKMNKLVFQLFLPCLLFCNIYGAELNDAFDLRMIVFIIGMVLAVFLATIAVVMKIEPSNKSRGAMIQAIYRSNFVILGLPVVGNIYDGENLATTALAVTIVVPLFNVLAVIALELFRGGKPNPLHILKGIVTNPLIIGAMLGVITIVLEIKLPEIAEDVLNQLKSAATPLALVTLGMSLNLKNFSSMKRNLTICVAGRLIVVPAVALSLAALAGIRDVAFVTLIAVFASPTAVTSFTMAEQMDSDGPLAANAVVFSSAFACVTMFGWIFIFKSLGMF